jgi:plasmid stability protein
MVMRTTLSLDDDLAAKLKSEARRSGHSFRDVVNDMLRRGLAGKNRLPTIKPFKVKAKSLGEPRPGLNLDRIAELIEQVEGPLTR